MLLSAFAILILSAQTPDAIELREGLGIRGVVRSGRTPIFTDAVLAGMTKKGWKAPKLNDSVTTQSGDKRAWSELKSGQDGSFDGQAIQSGYAYFEVDRPKPEIRVLESSGWGMAYVDGQPRAGDPYGFGYLKMPVKLNAGKTGFLFAAGRGRPRAKLVAPPARAFFNLGDTTFPDLIVGQTGQVWGGVIVVNATESWSEGLRISAKVGDGIASEAMTPAIPPLSFRKVPFWIEAPAQSTAGDVPLELTLSDENGMLDFQSTSLRARTPKQTRKVTFGSDIDGSIQYYAVNPAQSDGDNKALVLTLHGAGVEAIGQADAYQGKDWCHIVAPTNRRPYGFDWEETGRLDAIEVLAQAKRSLKTDPQQTYLTGHSMGGHGTWTVGLHYPDQWAAIAPCAGWISFFAYGAGPRQTPKNEVEEVVYRAANASDTLLLLNNSLHNPIYIHHGDKDDNVPVEQAREMKKHLDEIKHPNVTLHEQPGAGHWFGGESVDWPGIFDLFKSVRLKAKAEKYEVDFTTVNLAASSKAWWLQILQQEKPLAPSRAKFRRVGNGYVGSTENIEAIRFESGTSIEIDGQTIRTDNVQATTLKKRNGKWEIAEGILEKEKRPEQTGPFKEVFKNKFHFVYGTKGSNAEDEANFSKARYDAEVFAYRGNGSVRIVSDVQFLKEQEEEKKRVYIRKPDVPNVILFGNEDTNSAWPELLKDCPIRVRRGAVRLGAKEIKGHDLACLFVRPRAGDDKALVGVIASTGMAGQRVLERLPYFVSGVHFPDWTVISANMLTMGADGIKAAGYFQNDWKLSQD